MPINLISHARRQLQQLDAEGLTKPEYELTSPQAASVRISGDGDGGANTDIALINLCSNNYLGLADNTLLKAAAHQAIESHGLGMASVRFICGTQDLHHLLERRLADFLQVEAAILFASCFDANTGIFEALLGAEDAIVSDALNHASIIDGIRLCKARRLRYANNDMADLEARLKEAGDARFRLIVTDGVFSMDGILANLPGICDLAQKYDAMVMVDDSHAVGFIGPRGAGTPDHWGVGDAVQLLSGTFGKALGGAAGGYIAGPRPIVDLLRQKARPYLFSNALPPAIVAATLKALELVGEGAGARARLTENAQYFRMRMEACGFSLVPGSHPIIPVMLGDATLAQNFAAQLKGEGVYVTAFSYPVVPKGRARIRCQMSASHSQDDLEVAVEAFVAVGNRLDVI
jgi:glycine C-acetyltransferase